MRSHMMTVGKARLGLHTCMLQVAFSISIHHEFSICLIRFPLLEFLRAVALPQRPWIFQGPSFYSPF